MGLGHRPLTFKTNISRILLEVSNNVKLDKNIIIDHCKQDSRRRSNLHNNTVMTLGHLNSSNFIFTHKYEEKKYIWSHRNISGHILEIYLVTF